MIIERTETGVIAFQRVGGKGSKKVGFIAEGKTIAEAIDGVIWLVAAHCTNTGERPSSYLQPAVESVQ
jgi:hypothetical protein